MAPGLLVVVVMIFSALVVGAAMWLFLLGVRGLLRPINLALSGGDHSGEAVDIDTLRLEHALQAVSLFDRLIKAALVECDVASPAQANQGNVVGELPRDLLMG